MIADRDLVLEEEFIARLLAYDEALAEGRMPVTMDDGESTELRDSLERGLSCLHLLQRLRPRNVPDGSGRRATSITVADPGDEATPTAETHCPVSIGRFEILRTLGVGGFGIVYLA
jgi:hypothetical protein